MSDLKVLIIGGGMGGLTLAQSLRSKNIDFEIFERDDAPYSRDQGWAFALHRIIPQLREVIPEGAPALESVSVSAGQPEPDNAAFLNAYTKEVTGQGGGGGRPGQWLRANRAKLRDYLSTGLDIRWGKKYTRHQVENGLVKVFFEDGSTATGDILVGADGVASPVRELLYQPNPPKLDVFPAGIIAGEVILSREQVDRQTAIARSMYVCQGNALVLSVNLKCYSDDLSTGNYCWLALWPDEGARSPEYWTHTASGEDQLAFVKEKFKDVHPDLREILDYQKPEKMLKPLVIRERVPQACPPGPATLLGDAAHSMTFFGGEGANNAMQDAFELADSLATAVSGGTSYSNALLAYEAKMIPRATEAVLRSDKIAASFLSPMSVPRRPSGKD